MAPSWSVGVCIARSNARLMPCTLILTRHGEIKANRERRWHGATDSPLAWRGRRQAKRLGRYLARQHPQLDGVYSSPLQRCQDTAARIVANRQHAVQVDERLREWHLGDWEGLLFRELDEQHGFYKRVAREPDFRPPGGESLRDVAHRYEAALRDIAARHETPDADTQVAVVGHGAALAVALATLLDRQPARWLSYAIGNCSITELLLQPEPYVDTYNNTWY